MVFKLDLISNFQVHFYELSAYCQFSVNGGCSLLYIIRQIQIGGSAEDAKGTSATAAIFSTGANLL